MNFGIMECYTPNTLECNLTTAKTADIFNDSVFKIFNIKYGTEIEFSRYNENKNLPIQSYFLCFKKNYSFVYQIFKNLILSKQDY